MCELRPALCLDVHSAKLPSPRSALWLQAPQVCAGRITASWLCPHVAQACRWPCSSLCPAALHVLRFFGVLGIPRWAHPSRQVVVLLPWEAAPPIRLISWRGSGTFVCTFICAICATSTHTNASLALRMWVLLSHRASYFPCIEIHVSALKFRFCVHAKGALVAALCLCTTVTEAPCFLCLARLFALTSFSTYVMVGDLLFWGAFRLPQTHDRPEHDRPLHLLTACLNGHHWTASAAFSLPRQPCMCMFMAWPQLLAPATAVRAWSV